MYRTLNFFPEIQVSLYFRILFLMNGLQLALAVITLRLIID